MSALATTSIFSIDSSGALKTDTDAYLKQELGFNKRLGKEDRLLKSITDPTNYLGDRKKAIEEANKEVIALYQAQYKKYVAVGDSFEEAEKKAKAICKTIKKDLYRVIDEQYPVGVYGDAVKRVKVGKGNANF
jgi:hypothetical protein